MNLEEYLKPYRNRNFFDSLGVFQDEDSLYFDDIKQSNYKDYMYSITKFSELETLINYFVNNDESKSPMVIKI